MNNRKIVYPTDFGDVVASKTWTERNSDQTWRNAEFTCPLGKFIEYGFDPVRRRAVVVYEVSDFDSITMQDFRIFRQVKHVRPGEDVRKALHECVSRIMEDFTSLYFGDSIDG